MKIKLIFITLAQTPALNLHLHSIYICTQSTAALNLHLHSIHNTTLVP